MAPKVFGVPSLDWLFGCTVGSTSYIAITSGHPQGTIWTPSFMAPPSSDTTVECSPGYVLRHHLPITVQGHSLDHNTCNTLDFPFDPSPGLLILHLSHLLLWSAGTRLHLPRRGCNVTVSFSLDFSFVSFLLALFVVMVTYLVHHSVQVCVINYPCLHV